MGCDTEGEEREAVPDRRLSGPVFNGVAMSYVSKRLGTSVSLGQVCTLSSAAKARAALSRCE